MAILGHKFKAIRCEEDGIKFASKKERKRYQELKLLKEKGDVVQFLPQIPFRLPGGVKYICDFQVFWSDRTVSFEDVKGIKTPQYKNKKKLVEALYPPITITEV
jgi:hypothetical protein